MLFLLRVLQPAGRWGALFRCSPVGLSLGFSVREIHVTNVVTVMVPRGASSGAWAWVMRRHWVRGVVLPVACGSFSAAWAQVGVGSWGWGVVRPG